MKRIFALLAALALLCGMVSFAVAEDITYTGVITGGSLHLRREPSSSAKVIQTYKAGTEVQILENDGTWCKVQVGKNMGYMMAEFLDIKPNYPHLGWGKTADDGTVVNVRAGAGATFPVVYKAMSGCAFELIEEAGGWYRVRTGSQFGYVEKDKIQTLSGDFELAFSIDDTTSAITASSLQTAVREYGSPKSIVRSEGDFTYSLTYPETGVAAADAALSAWTQGMLRAFEADQKQNHPAEKASCAVEYQSISLDSRYHSVLLIAEYKVGGLKAEAVLALNIDSQEGAVLDNESLFSANENRALFCLESAASKLIPKPTDGYASAPDKTWLKYAALAHDGVQLYLPAGLYIPQGWGTRRLTLRYTQVAECMPLSSDTLDSFLRVIDPSQPMIALTFDDGPSEYTDRILNVLLEYDARATFCVIGNKVNLFPDVLRRTVAGGNEIACHTWSHPNLTNLSAAKVRYQIESTVNAVRDITGYEVKVLRPPYGKHNKTVRSICAEMDIVIAHWELDTRDWSSRNTNKVYNAIMKGTKNGYIILCHDLYATTAAAVEKAIPELIAKGYQLVTVSELLSFHKDGATPGKVYNRVDPENIVTGQ